MNVTTLDDTALVAMIAGAFGRRGTDSNPTLNAAVAALYDRYGRLVFTVALHVVNDAETAEEITQDVFVRLCENAHTYHGEIAKVSSWLVSITRNRAIDELRRRSARAEKDRADWPEDIGLENMDGLPVSEGPEAAAEAAIRGHGVRQVIKQLPPEQRQVLALAFFNGLSHSQIADHLGEPLGTVKSRVRLAMQKLRDALVEHGVIDL